MRVNVSQIVLFQTCPQKWFNRYVRQRVPQAQPTALATGTIVHKVLERYFFDRKNGLDHGAAKEYLLAELDLYRLGTENPKVRDELKLLLNNFLEWEGPSLFTGSDIIAIEEPKEFPLNDQHTLVIKPDVVVAPAGIRWHVQNRTLAAASANASYLKSRRLDSYELGYAWVLSEGGKLPYSGTIMNIIKKGKTPPFFIEEPVPINMAHVKDFVRDAVISADLMEDIVNHNISIEQRRSACLNRYGNGLCEYFDVCTKNTTLNDPRYIDAERGYYEQENK